MNPVINKILNNILILSGGKFINLLKIEENQYSILGFNGNFDTENDLLESFNKELCSIKELGESGIRKLKSFKKILKEDAIKDYYFGEMKNSDRVKIILNLFSQSELTNGTIEKIKPFESLIETLLDSQNYIYESEISKLQLAILVTDKNGEKISANKFFDTNFNIDKEKSLKESLAIYNLENEKLEFENYPFNIAAMKKENQVEQRIKLFAGENIYKTYKVNSIVSLDNNGEVEKVINSFWDITDLAEAEEVVKETAKNIESILYSTGPDASNFYFVSDAVKKMFGYSPEDIYNKRVSFLRKIYPQYLKNMREFINNLREGKRSFVEYKFIDSSGVERMVRHTGVPVIKDGDVIRIVGVIYDITDERRIVEELEKSEEKFRILIETANDLIFSLDSYGYFKW